MENVLIDISEQNETIRGLFEPELYISVNALLDKLDLKASEVESLKLEIEELKTPDEDPDNDFMQKAKDSWL